MRIDDSSSLRPMLEFKTRWLINIVLAFVVLGLALGSWFTVAEYERGIVTTWGKLSRIETPGLNFKIPFVQSVEKWRTDVQEISPKEKANTYTEDNQEIDIVWKVFYRLPPDRIGFIWANAQDYHSRLFFVVNDRLKAEMGKVKLEHFAANRGAVRSTLLATLQTDVSRSLGVDVTDFQFTDVSYTKAFRDAVEKASVQKANVETREWERQQAEKTALRRKIEAEGEANAAREKAKGEADAIRVVADANASALRVQNAALRENKDVLELRRIEVELAKAQKWNGALPAAIYAGAPVPFLNVGK